MKKRKVLAAAVALLCFTTAQSYVQAEGVSGGEDTALESTEFTGENPEQDSPNSDAVYEDSIIAIYTEGYPYSEEDEKGTKDSTGNIKNLFVQIFVDEQSAAGQVIEYQEDPGKLEVQVKEAYGIDHILLNGEPFDTGNTVDFGEEDEERLEVHLYTRAKLIIHYQDTEGNALAEDTMIEGKFGESVSWENPEIEGYELSEAADTAVLGAGTQEITVTYGYKEIETVNLEETETEEIYQEKFLDNSVALKEKETESNDLSQSQNLIISVYLE